MTASINTVIRNAFTAMASNAIEYAKAAEQIRAIRARGEIETKEVREIAKQALLAKVPAYKTQVTEQGNPAQGSAFQRALSRLMADTNPDKGEKATHKATVRVPRELQAAIATLAGQYDVKLIRAALARI